MPANTGPEALFNLSLGLGSIDRNNKPGTANFQIGLVVSNDEVLCLGGDVRDRPSMTVVQTAPLIA